MLMRKNIRMQSWNGALSTAITSNIKGAMSTGTGMVPNTFHGLFHRIRTGVSGEGQCYSPFMDEKAEGWGS